MAIYFGLFQSSAVHFHPYSKAVNLNVLKNSKATTTLTPSMRPWFLVVDSWTPCFTAWTGRLYHRPPLREPPQTTCTIWAIFKGTICMWSNQQRNHKCTYICVHCLYCWIRSWYGECEIRSLASFLSSSSLSLFFASFWCPNHNVIIEFGEFWIENDGLFYSGLVSRVKYNVQYLAVMSDPFWDCLLDIEIHALLQFLLFLPLQHFPLNSKLIQ